MKLLLDMNISPDLVRSIAAHRHDVVHWSHVGALLAPPRVSIAKPLQVVQVMWFTVSSSDGAALVAPALLSVLIFPLRAGLGCGAPRRD